MYYTSAKLIYGIIKQRKWNYREMKYNKYISQKPACPTCQQKDCSSLHESQKTEKGQRFSQNSGDA
jgi:hypothetical protein